MPLYGIPYIFMKNINSIIDAESGDMCLDELWLQCDSRLSLQKKNRFVATVLGRSRKKGLNIYFTCQVIDSIDKRIRKIVDFTSLPQLSPREDACRVSVFRGGYPKDGSFLKTFWFKTPMLFQMFDTNYCIEMTDDDNPAPMPIYFQETKDSPLMEFKSFEEADKFAEQFWTKHPYLLKQIF